MHREPCTERIFAKDVGMGTKKIKQWVKVMWAVCALVCLVAGLLSEGPSQAPLLISIGAGMFCLIVTGINYGEITEWETDQLEDADDFIRRKRCAR
jgi:hypothetical protein